LAQERSNRACWDKEFVKRLEEHRDYQFGLRRERLKETEEERQRLKGLRNEAFDTRGWL
jgi:hypothetical protein